MLFLFFREGLVGRIFVCVSGFSGFIFLGVLVGISRVEFLDVIFVLCFFLCLVFIYYIVKLRIYFYDVLFVLWYEKNF